MDGARLLERQKTLLRQRLAALLNAAPHGAWARRPPRQDDDFEIRSATASFQSDLSQVITTSTVPPCRWERSPELDRISLTVERATRRRVDGNVIREDVRVRYLVSISAAYRIAHIVIRYEASAEAASIDAAIEQLGAATLAPECEVVLPVVVPLERLEAVVRMAAAYARRVVAIDLPPPERVRIDTWAGSRTTVVRRTFPTANLPGIAGTGARRILYTIVASPRELGTEYTTNESDALATVLDSGFVRLRGTNPRPTLIPAIRGGYVEFFRLPTARARKRTAMTNQTGILPAWRIPERRWLSLCEHGAKRAAFTDGARAQSRPTHNRSGSE